MAIGQRGTIGIEQIEILHTNGVTEARQQWIGGVFRHIAPGIFGTLGSASTFKRLARVCRLAGGTSDAFHRDCRLKIVQSTFNYIRKKTCSAGTSVSALQIKLMHSKCRA